MPRPHERAPARLVLLSAVTVLQLSTARASVPGTSRIVCRWLGAESQLLGTMLCSRRVPRQRLGVLKPATDGFIEKRKWRVFPPSPASRRAV